ncbi:MAG: protein kinase [Anaerolineae bacterium]
MKHQNLPRILDYGVENGTPYIARDYLPGGTLGQRIRLTGPLSPEEALAVLRQLAGALDAIHAHGLTHFGIMPDTIVRDDAGSVYLSDLGLAQLSIEVTGIPDPMLPYSAPEVFLREPYTPAVDIYSLGGVLFTMLTGDLPFNGSTYVQWMESHLNRRVPSVEAYAEMPAGMEDIVDKAMEKLAYLRYASASEMVTAVGRVLGETRISAEGAGGKGGAPRATSQSFKTTRAVAGGRSESPSQLYADALMMEGQNPAQAAELYRRLIEIQPQRAQGEVNERLYRIEQELGEKRIPALMTEAREARAIGDWQGLTQVTRQVLSYEPEHTEAFELNVLGQPLQAAESHYLSAYAAATTDHWDAAIMLLDELYTALPDYEDPEALAVITAGKARFIHNTTTFTAHKRQVRALDFSPESDYLVTGSTYKSVKLWELPGYAEVAAIDDHQTWVCSTIFSPDGTLMFAGTWEGLIKIWTVPDGEYAGVIAGQTSQVRAMAFAHHDARILATASGYFLTLWALPAGKRIAVVRESDRRPVTALDFAPGEPLLICGMNNGHLRVRSVNDPGLGIVLDEAIHEGPIYTVASSPDGMLVATGGRDSTVSVVRLENGEVLHRLLGHTETVHAVAFSNDGTLLASGSRDHSIVLWRVEDGALIARLEGHTDEVRSLHFSPDGRALVSGGADGMVKVWGIL